MNHCERAPYSAILHHAFVHQPLTSRVTAHPSSSPCVIRTLMSSPSPIPILLSRSYEKLARREPPRRSHAYFQKLAEQRRTQPPPPNTSAALTYSPPQPPLTVYHGQYHNPYFTRVQQLEQQEAIRRSKRSLDATHTASQPPSAAAAATVFAVVELNGAQHKVVEDDLIMADLLRDAEVGSTLRLDNVLLLGSAQWTVIGRPVVGGASVDCVVEEHARTDKVLVFHKKRRKNHKKMKGYRGDVTVLRVTKLNVPAVEPEGPAGEAEAAESRRIEG